MADDRAYASSNDLTMRTKCNRKKTLAVFGGLLTVLVLAAVVVFLCHRGTQDPLGGGPLMTIETKYGTLRYPRKWEAYLEVETLDEGDTLCFYAQIRDTSVHLFDFYFNGETGGYLGTLRGADVGTVNVSMLVYEPESREDWTEEEEQILGGMLEDVNYVIQSFSEDLVQLPQEQEKFSASLEGDVLIETAYGVLKYPGKWRNQVHIQITEGEPYQVTFSGSVEDQLQYPLFTICFDTEQTQPLLWITTESGVQVGVTLQSYEIPWSAGWTEDMVNNLYAMQEEANYVLQNLEQDHPASDGLSEETDEAIRIPTAYEDLYFPAKWKDVLQTSESAGQIDTVTFWMLRDNAEQILLFSLSFGDEDGLLVGTILDENGRAIPVTLTMEEAPSMDGWSQEEMDQMYAMKDDVNYLISKLPLT